MYERISLHNYIGVLNNIATKVDETSVVKARSKIKMIYSDRVINDYPAPCDEQNLLLSFLETSVEDFIQVYYRYRPSRKNCCCFRN